MTFAQRKKREAVVARFVKYLEQQPNGCVYWKGSLLRAGYGQFYFEGAPRQAHRVAYRLFAGPIADGLFVCHSCDTPACVYPGHLFLGTPRDNRVDCIRKGRAIFVNNRPPLHRKLSDDQVRAIRGSATSAEQLAGEFNVNPGTIYNARTHRTYAHVD